MAHVSNKKLPTKVRERIDTQLIDVLTKRWTRDAKTSVLYELLTKTEKLMFAKRVAMIAMIGAGCSSYEIAQSLGVGNETVARFTQSYRSKKFKNIAQILDDGNNAESISEIVEVLIHVGMPSRSTRRSKTFRKLREKEQEQKRRRANPNR